MSSYIAIWAFIKVIYFQKWDIEARTWTSAGVDTPCRDRLKRKVGIPQPVHWFWSVTSLFLKVWRHTLRLPWITWGVSNPFIYGGTGNGQNNSRSVSTSWSTLKHWSARIQLCTVSWSCSWSCWLRSVWSVSLQMLNSIVKGRLCQ